MKFQHKNPHTFDMSNYYSGMTCVVGGRDFEMEEKTGTKIEKEMSVIRSEKKIAKELDWSFLKSLAPRKTT